MNTPGKRETGIQKESIINTCRKRQIDSIAMQWELGLGFGKVEFLKKVPLYWRWDN